MPRLGWSPRSFLLPLAAKAAEDKDITVTFPDGRQVQGKAWKTTPFELAVAIRFFF